MDSEGTGWVGSVALSPQLQPDWDYLHLRNLRWQGTRFDVSFERQRQPDPNASDSRAAPAGPSASPVSIASASPETLTVTVSSKTPGESLPLSIGIRLPPGAEPLDDAIRGLLESRESLGPEIPGEDRRVRGLEIHWLVKDGAADNGLTVTYRPGIELRPVHEPLRLGDRSQRMRVIDAWLEDGVYTARLEGLAGRTYQLDLDVRLGAVAAGPAVRSRDTPRRRRPPQTARGAPRTEPDQGP